MKISRTNWHAIVAAGTVVGGECADLKDEGWRQILHHGPFFWVCLFAAIVVGIGNSILSTNAPPTHETPPSDPPGPGPSA